MAAHRYNQMNVVISAKDAHAVLDHFFHRVPPLAAIDQYDRRFAQGLIVSAAHANVAFGIIHKLWEKASSPTAKPLGIVKAVAKAVVKGVNNIPRTVEQAVETDMYATLLTAVAYKNRGQWEVRMQTDDGSCLALDDSSFSLV